MIVKLKQMGRKSQLKKVRNREVTLKIKKYGTRKKMVMALELVGLRRHCSLGVLLGKKIRWTRNKSGQEWKTASIR